MLHGKSTVWHHTGGEVMSEMSYKYGRPDGKQIFYDKNGKVEKVVEYKNGQRVN